jgi:hypothetical protein
VSLGTGLAVILLGAFLMIVGMYAWTSTPGQFSFFVGVIMAVTGICISFLRAGQRRW